MINNISNVDTRLPMSAAKTGSSMFGGVTMPPLLSFKKPPKKDKAELRVQKFKRSDNIIIEGVIDEDYRGPVIVPLYNDSKMPMTVAPDERIAQLIVMPYINCEISEVSVLTDTERAEGGFGSTGTK